MTRERGCIGMIEVELTGLKKGTHFSLSDFYLRLRLPSLFPPYDYDDTNFI